MRKLFAFIVVFCLLCINVYADIEIDISSLTDDELYALMDGLQEELGRRNQEHVKNSIDSAGYYTAEFIMSRYLEIENSNPSSEHTKLNDDYTVWVTNGIRLLEYNNRIMKISARLDMEDGVSSVKRMYLIASIFEEKLFEKDSISAAEKKGAFESAQNIVDTAMNLFGDNLAKVITSGEEGFRLLAATGTYVYSWEYIDGSAWLSIAFTSLPDGIK